MLRKRSPFSLHEYGVRRGQEHWDYWDYWDLEDTVDWTDRTGPGQADMDGQNGSSSICSRQDTKKKKKEEIPDRVTLKKEIGLLSACTIIIGEAGKQASCSGISSVLSITARFKTRSCRRTGPQTAAEPVLE